MNCKYMRMVFSTSRSKHTTRLVLLALARYADHAGVFCIEPKQIASDCKASVKTVLIAIDWLCKNGEIEKLSEFAYKIKL